MLEKNESMIIFSDKPRYIGQFARDSLLFYYPCANYNLTRFSSENNHSLVLF